MSYIEFDRMKLHPHPLSERVNRVFVEEDLVHPDQESRNHSVVFQRDMTAVIERVRRAQEKSRPVVLAFGAHTIKNGLAPILIKLMEEKYVTHLATNGAGVIHDWELAYQGQTSEHVAENVKHGRFGLWEETGRFVNLAINVGAYEGKGYGESVGSLIANNGLTIPSATSLEEEMIRLLKENPAQAAAAADLLHLVRRFHLPSGFIAQPHVHAACSVAAAAYRLGVPFTSHPMFGHDIIYTHPMNHGPSIGRAAERDFLRFVRSIQDIEGGVYLSVGSAVMSPMIFEKSLSMSRNLLLQEKKDIKDFLIGVVDLAQSNWDWNQNGEPPESDPAYYLRYCKTFSRMGGEMRYVSADNRDFLLALLHGMKKI
jgi:hypothetical protein